MSTGLLDCLLNTQSKTILPAAQKMQVVMISREHLIRNPDNQIYIIGDVSRLKEDIKVNGIRQPLEVVDLEDGNYKLIGGERRLTACEQLAAEGETGYEKLPCVIRESKDPDDDKIALITANATARELTDGERLSQYEALKGILARRKKNGQLQGKVRDELCRILGLSSGAAARLNAISENCTPEVRQQLRDGELSLMGAYRFAQAVIADKTADIKMPENVRKNPSVFEKKETAPETLPEAAAKSEAQPQKAEVNAAEKRDEFPEWALKAAAELCKADWITTLPEFTAERIRKRVDSEWPEIEDISKKGCHAYCTPTTVFLGDEQDSIEMPWENFVEACKKAGIAPEHKEPKLDDRGRATMLALAEKELGSGAGWAFERNLYMFQLDFFYHSLPGGAKLWRMDDPQRDAAGLAPGDHVRYAIILQDGKFFTTGWEHYNDAVESLIRYLDLR